MKLLFQMDCIYNSNFFSIKGGYCFYFVGIMIYYESCQKSAVNNLVGNILHDNNFKKVEL